MRLGDLLQPFFPDFSDHACSPEHLFTQLFPEESTFQSQKMYDTWSQLGKVLLDFLAHERLRTGAGIRNSLVLDALDDIHAHQHFKRLYDQSLLPHEPGPKDQEEALDQMLIAQRGAQWFAARQLREQDDSLARAMEATDSYYLLARLKYSCEWLNRRNILPEAEPEAPGFFPSPDSWPPHSFADPLIAMYRQVFDMLQDDEEAAFRQLAPMLRQHAATISPQEATNLYAYAQNFCIRRVNQGEPAYLDTLFDLYRTGLDLGLLTSSGELDHRQYKNIVTVGLRLRQLEWVEQFIEDHRESLPPDYRDNAFRFNLASLRYDQQRYGEALSLLQEVNIGDVYYQLSARAMILKIYFEQEEEEALEHFFDTFRMFLQRNKDISSYQRQVHLNLVRYTRKLHQLRGRRYRMNAEAFAASLQQLGDQMRERKNIANLSWLEEQIEAFASTLV